MRDVGNKEVMAKNLRHHMERKGVTPKELSQAIQVPYTTILSWLKAVNYPRIDKIDGMADYFGILKSDLIEEQTEEQLQAQKKNDALADIVLRMRSDDKFLSAVEAIYDMDDERLTGLLGLLK